MLKKIKPYIKFDIIRFDDTEIEEYKFHQYKIHLIRWIPSGRLLERFDNGLAIDLVLSINNCNM